MKSKRIGQKRFSSLISENIHCMIIGFDHLKTPLGYKFHAVYPDILILK